MVSATVFRDLAEGSGNVSTRSCSRARQGSPKHVLVGEEIVEKPPPIKRCQDCQIFRTTKRAKTFETHHKSSLHTQFSLLMPSCCFDWLTFRAGKQASADYSSAVERHGTGVHRKR